jgi:predicted acyl esterase
MSSGEGFDYIWQPSFGPPRRVFPEFGHKIERIENNVIFERDHAITLRDGVKLYADIFRPDTDEKVPAIMTYAPYGKENPSRYENYYKKGGVKDEWLSKYAIYEAPDPMWWAPKGFAIVNVDSRGMWHSEGEATFMNRAEGRDGYDAIEHLAQLDWCNGKIGMAGVSYLAICQWQIAATRPPHLAAFNLWEGVSDCYREMMLHGGIPESHFIPRWNANRLNAGLNRAEDLAAMVKAHPLWDAYWESKRAVLKDITAPAYIVASWSDHGLHTRGTLQGFREISSQQKWLEIHGRKKWEYFMQPSSVARQHLFFDHFLRGADNALAKWPKVWMEAREKYDAGKFRAEKDWPIARTRHGKLFLDAKRGKLRATPIAARAKLGYDAPQRGTRVPDAYGEHRATFSYRFAKPTELTGYMKLKLWVEAEGNDDMDLFVALQKFDRNGKHVGFPCYNAMEDGPVAQGWLRVSHRELDPDRSTPEQPWLLHRRMQKLKPKEIVPVEIEIWPSSTKFLAAEILRLVVQGSDVYAYAGVGYAHPETLNHGRHIIHTGGKYDSHLLIATLPAR